MKKWNLIDMEGEKGKIEEIKKSNQLFFRWVWGTIEAPPFIWFTGCFFCPKPNTSFSQVSKTIEMTPEDQNQHQLHVILIWWGFVFCKRREAKFLGSYWQYGEKVSQNLKYPCFFLWRGLAISVSFFPLQISPKLDSFSFFAKLLEWQP